MNKNELSESFSQSHYGCEHPSLQKFIDLVKCNPSNAKNHRMLAGHLDLSAKTEEALHHAI